MGYLIYIKGGYLLIYMSEALVYLYVSAKIASTAVRGEFCTNLFLCLSLLWTWM